MCIPFCSLHGGDDPLPTGEYVRGEVHTCCIDGFWSLIKRGIMGNFHHVSKTYLPLYLNEFSFRYNNRKNDDIFAAVVAGS